MKTVRTWALAGLSVFVALVLTLAIAPVRHQSPYLLLTLGVMVSANFGLGPGVFATLLSVAMGAYFLIPPLHSFAISGPENSVPLLLFCVVGLSITWITHRLRLSKEKAEFNRRELETVITSMSDGLVVVGPHGEPLMMNPAALKLHGYQDASEAVAPLSEVAELFELRGADGNVLLPERWPGSRALTGEVVTNLEIEVSRRDTGRRFIGYYNAVPVRNQDGEVQLVVITITDITESKQIEQRLRDSQKLESIGLLAGGIAHDFNNLLVGVIGNASLAREILPPGHSAADLLERVVKTGEQAAHLTRQMLAYAGKGQFVLERLNLSGLVSEMSGLLQPSISKKIALRLELEPDLPPVFADRSQIQQILMNLVLNAAEAIGTGTGSISLRTGVQDVDDHFMQQHPGAGELQRGKYLYLEVRDTGCGMDAATQSRIFDPFFSTKFVGRGLGLAAVAGIVRGHKGVILVNSRRGEGSCFTVLFPAVEGVPETSSSHIASTSLRGTGTVLVVDDEATVRELAQKALERHGYDVLLAESGLAAIDVFKQKPQHISLVVLDLSMPGLGGNEILPALYGIRSDVKVVVSSGYTEAEAMKQFTGQRIDAFLQKPYTAATIVEKVKSALG